MWLFEVALLIYDQPRELDALQREGNFLYMMETRVITSPAHYYQELGQWVLLLGRRGRLNNEEFDTAVNVYDNLPPIIGSPIPLEDVQNQTGVLV